MDKDFLILEKIFSAKPFEVVKERNVKTDAGNRDLVVFRGESTLRTSWGFIWETQKGGNPRSLCLEIGPYFQLSQAEAKSMGIELVQAIMDGNKDWLERYKTFFKYGPTVGDIYNNILIQEYNDSVIYGIGDDFYVPYDFHEYSYRVVTKWIYGILDEPIECIPPKLLLDFTYLIFPLNTETFCLYDIDLSSVEDIFEIIKEKGITKVNLAEGLHQLYQKVLCDYGIYKKLLSKKSFQKLLANIDRLYKSSKRASFRLACAFKIQSYICLDTKELLGLRWSDINFTRKLLKRRRLPIRELDFPLPEQVIDILDKLKGNNKERNQFIFYSRNDKNEHIDEDNYRKHLTKYIDKNDDISMVKDIFKEYAKFCFIFEREGDLHGFNLAQHLGIKGAPYEVPEKLAPKERVRWLIGDLRSEIEAYARHVDSLTKEGLEELDKITKN